jgi:hypothetical protein
MRMMEAHGRQPIRQGLLARVPRLGVDADSGGCCWVLWHQMERGGSRPPPAEVAQRVQVKRKPLYRYSRFLRRRGSEPIALIGGPGAAWLVVTLCWCVCVYVSWSGSECVPAWWTPSPR